MKKLTLTLCLLLALAMQAEAQKKAPTQSKVPITTSPKVPALPTETGIMFHRMKNKALYLTIKNTGTKPIKRVTCSGFITDMLTMKRIAEFNFLNFDYAVEVSPQQSYTAIVDEDEWSELKGNNITFGKCKGYAYTKDKTGKWERSFIPNSCTQDAFVLMIISVTFSDGTTWLPPEVASVIQDNKYAKGKLAKPYEQPSFKLSQLKQRKITKQEFGELWIFTPIEGVLACNSSDEERLYFLDGTKAYPLNGWALDTKIEGIKVLDLKDVVRNDSGIQLFMKIASSLCK